MKRDDNDNAIASAATSRPRRLTEIEYLDHQASNARRAMRGAWRDMGRNVGRGLDPRPWTAEHPWFAVGVATAVGLGLALIPIPRFWKRSSSNTNSAPPAQPSQPSHPFFGKILAEVVSRVRPWIPVLTESIISMVSARSGSSHPEEQRAEDGN
jgi:hypothetical protein